MNMADKSAGTARYRISVPVSDTSVLEWISHQYNLSYSIRTIIKDFIQRNGMVDATCDVVQKISRGCPSKKSMEMMEQAERAIEQGYAEAPQEQGYDQTVAMSTPRAGMGSAQATMMQNVGQAYEGRGPVQYSDPAGERPVRQPQGSYQQPQMGQAQTTAGRAAQLLDM